MEKEEIVTIPTQIPPACPGAKVDPPEKLSESEGEKETAVATPVTTDAGERKYTNLKEYFAENGDKLTGEQMAQLITQNDKSFVVVKQIMDSRNAISKMETMRDKANHMVKSMVPDDKLALLTARARTLDKEALANLDMAKDADWKKVEEVYTFEDGSKIYFANNPDTKDLTIRAMHRDYLIYLRTIEEENEKYELAQASIKADLDKIYAELDELIGKETADEIRSFKGFADFYINWIDKLLENPDVPEKAKEHFKKVKDADERGVNLTFLFDNVKETMSKKGNTDSLFFGFRNNFDAAAKSAVSILKTKFEKYGYHSAFPKFYNLEERFLPEIGKEYNNLFMYILFRYIKFNYEKFDTFWMITIGEISTQIGYLAREDDEKPERCETFRQNVIKLLKCVISNKSKQ